VISKLKTAGQVAVALVVAAAALWLLGSALAAISGGPVDPGECAHAYSCDR